MTKTVLNVALYNINNSITIIMEFLLHVLCTAAHLENTDNMLSWLTVILLDLFYTDSIYKCKLTKTASVCPRFCSFCRLSHAQNMIFLISIWVFLQPVSTAQTTTNKCAENIFLLISYEI